MDSESAPTLSERRLLESQRVGEIGHWEYILETRQIVWSEMVFKIFGRDPALGPPSVEDEARYYSPEDARSLREHAAWTIESGEPYELEVTANLPDGRVVELGATGSPVYGPDGRMIRLLGTVRDISRRKRVEKALQECQVFNETLLKAIPFPMDVVDEDGRVVFMNKLLREQTAGMPQGERCWSTYMDDRQRCPDCPLRRAGQTNQTYVLERPGMMGGKVFRVVHVDILYQNKRALLKIFIDQTETSPRSAGPLTSAVPA
ncbi:MAG: PAS domain-containing protein [bacterium]|nr:PAS domain-containing protein [bacterium]